MVRLNKTQLTEKQLHALYDQLSHTMGSLPQEKFSDFLKELLGYEERIMLAKRLAAIILLLEGATLYRTANVLKISPTTAKKIQRAIEKGDYTHIITSLQKSKRTYLSILETLDSILHFGGLLPHYNGLERYRSLK